MEKDDDELARARVVLSTHVSVLRAYGSEHLSRAAEMESGPSVEVGERRLDDAVLDCAKFWWQKRRPPRWTESRHMKNPTVNCPTHSERELAKAVFAYILAGREKDQGP